LYALFILGLAFVSLRFAYQRLRLMFPSSWDVQAAANPVPTPAIETIPVTFPALIA